MKEVDVELKGEQAPERIWIRKDGLRVSTALQVGGYFDLGPPNDEQSYLFVRADSVSPVKSEVEATQHGLEIAADFISKRTFNVPFSVLAQEIRALRPACPAVAKLAPTLDELSWNPTVEEADAYLRGEGVIKKCEVCGQDATLTNNFVTYLAERHIQVAAERDSLKAQVERLREAATHAKTLLLQTKNPDEYVDGMINELDGALKEGEGK